MNRELKQILSVSRRTDIPAFYMPWFMDQVTRGLIEVVNPFNQQVRQVVVSPERVHTMVFWSKNFGPFLADRYGEQFQAMGYHLFFNFTVNSRSPILEPEVPDLNQRLDQLRQLCHRFGSTSVQWRFDPICHFTTKAGAIENNLDDFETIATAAGKCGIGTCTTSFMDHYRKIERRTRNALTFVEPSPAEKTKILLNMEQTLSPLGIQLSLCCEKEALGQLPARSTISAGACISGRRIMAVHGGRVSIRQDPGQRKASGCGCTVSVDVGSYSLHPCHHNCLFCYANPACDQRRHQ
ncbi:MAG: DUF1848 domain-containing protein [Desulfosarcina sp.]|nr:DUF1848 domain-containing protein [Desulfosarcina sp.]MBC2743276.1 DUF1848 domain-containing protein [Desulfosarcina sp.]MBC2766186.1 DUF1848 domain-containing protein [Desulfosarcina sp.]